MQHADTPLTDLLAPPCRPVRFPADNDPGWSSPASDGVGPAVLAAVMRRQHDVAPARRQRQEAIEADVFQVAGQEQMSTVVADPQDQAVGVVVAGDSLGRRMQDGDSSAAPR